jgi:hypothetical protein
MGARHAVLGVLALAALVVGLELRAVLRSESRASGRVASGAGANGAPSAQGAVERADAASAEVDAASRAASEGPHGAPGAWPARFTWGSGAGALGREARSEGNAEGPPSLAVGANGTLVVLDAVNGRVTLTDARGVTSTVPSPLAAPFDVAALPGGGVAVLDRLVDRSLAILDARGETVARVALPARAGDPSLLTGVFASGGAVCVEREHGACVPVATSDGAPPKGEEEIPGRPASDGVSLLHAGIVAPPSARVYVRRTRASPLAHAFTREIPLPSLVRSLDFLDANDAGELYLALTLEAAPDEHLVVCLATQSGLELGRQRVPASPLPDEVNRAFAALPGGGFVYLYRTVDGAEPRRYPCAP